MNEEDMYGDLCKGREYAGDYATKSPSDCGRELEKFHRFLELNPKPTIAEIEDFIESGKRDRLNKPTDDYAQGEEHPELGVRSKDWDQSEDKSQSDRVTQSQMFTDCDIPIATPQEAAAARYYGTPEGHIDSEGERFTVYSYRGRLYILSDEDELIVHSQTQVDMEAEFKHEAKARGDYKQSDPLPGESGDVTQERGTECFGIGKAIKELWNGASVAREGWNGPGQYIGLQTPDENSKMSLPYLYIHTAQGDLVPWLASQTDILATDWYVKREPLKFFSLEGNEEKRQYYGGVQWTPEEIEEN